MSKLKREKLAELTTSALKELLQKQGLSTSGNKDAMIDRLLMVNSAGPGVMVVETVSVAKGKKAATAPEPTPEEPTPPPVESPTPEKPDDAVALIAQLKELVAQAQSAVTAAQQAQKAAEDAAAALSHKKEKADKKGKKDKKKKEKNSDK